MKVSLVLSGFGEVIQKELPEGTTVNSLVSSLNGWSAAATKILVNQREAAKTTILKDRDEIVLIPTNPKLALRDALYWVDAFLRACAPFATA